MTTHTSILGEQRQALGLGDSVIRFSVAIEHPGRLINDLSYALNGGRSPFPTTGTGLFAPQLVTAAFRDRSGDL